MCVNPPGAPYRPWELLVNRGGRLEIHLLPFAANDSGTNLLGHSSFFVFRVTVVKLFQACCALRSVGIFKTAVQAVVTHAVAVAVARLLVQHDRNFGG